MRRPLQIILTAVLFAAPLWACSYPDVDPDPGKPSDTGLTGVRKWIYDQLCEWYYWNDAVKKATPPSDVNYEDFLENLLANLKGAQDNTENPPTMDGYYSGSTRHIYSYIERTAATRAEGESMTFGFGFEPFWLDKDKELYCFLITWIQPDGPADKAGLKRGSWIHKYNGKGITFNDYVDFFYQVYRLDGSLTMNLTEENGESYRITAGSMKIDPIIYNDVVESPKKKKAAYLVYNEFENGENGEYDTRLRNVFAEFKSAGAEHLILDLRYNPGGYVSCCQLLTTLAANVDANQIFAKLQYNGSINKTNPTILRFRKGEKEENRLGLSKIYVLATGGSASASEMVINSLRGVGIEVIHIGQQTNGKNVGMDRLPANNKTITFDGYNYEMWPITFKIKNNKDFCNYAGGFTPDYLIDEFRNRNTVGVLELGNPNEELLKAALTLIDGGKPVVDKATRAEDPYTVSNPLRIERGGAKIVRDENGEPIEL